MRIVGDDEHNNEVMSLTQALEIAEEKGVDLVEISRTDIPVCRMIDYSKFVYQLKKKMKENKTKQHTVVMKEIRFGPNTDEHDIQFKLKHAQKFLNEGNKLKCYIRFYGRSIIYKDKGKERLLDFAERLEDIAKIERAPKMEGKRMFMILTPIKSK